ncbi:phosphoenolpyruvate synthase [Paenibacillus timonensis]|uniref:Phosphoenolpyruvate synthase n=2 Tax=Paenibacillus TaxID=44249 RepID=A0ABW3SJC8_9BACL|nr:phosphoenolpyruvate synthase [Paenibacillus timonensis]MCH1643040.1 phosphoenolpyruvate synthase [Paenibacillus timonensis]
MKSLVIELRKLDQAQLSRVGGKGLNLAKLSTIDGIHVPEGFIVTTTAFQQAVEHNETYRRLRNQLMQLQTGDLEQIGDICRQIRQILMEVAVPPEVAEAVSRHLSRFDETQAYAVRSSATAEDLPQASFAGQQDSYLNVIGYESILEHLRQCWASLYTDRAVIYRMRNGFNHGQITISVIIQKMVFPQASGILFTADPVDSNRKVLSIDAGFGLGEALVSGLVSADGYKVKEGKIVEKRIAAKTLAIYGRTEGGTETKSIDPGQQKAQVLTDEQILRLDRIGRRIEAFFGQPQDIEWCLAEDTFYIVQSRPITTLYPIPKETDQGNHVYVSVGHQQMMTDPIKPLGLSFYLLTTPAPMRTAGGRLFVDVMPMLASPDSRQMIIDTMGHSEPLIKDALITVVERGDFIPSMPHDPNGSNAGKRTGPLPSANDGLGIDNDPNLVSDLIKRSQASIEALKHNIREKSGTELMEFIQEDIVELKKILFDPQSTAVIMAGMNASKWINEKMNEWLGEKNAADSISQSVPGNITSEMGLALMDVADVIRPYPEIIAYLEQAEDDDRFLDELSKFEGGAEVRDAIDDFLGKYGMRCPGEIDITRTRWVESPIMLVPVILSNIRLFEPNASRWKFEQGRQVALHKEQELLERLSRLPDGEQKAKETKRMIDRIRNFSGFREYPKYGMIHRYFIYKQALLKESERLALAGVISDKEDIYYLTFEELRETIRTNRLDGQIISERKEEYKLYEKLIPPRVMTSDGEIIRGKYQREHLPVDAIVGLPVSSGVVEGRARVIMKMEDAVLEEGDILVTSFTDPSWTPLFVSLRGLVTEVGGLMTHGSVIAREYGLPAVVGAENATQRIKDGQRIRVNGTEGYIELI